MYSLVLICRKRSIKVALTQMENSASGSSDTASKEVEPWEVRVFLDDTLAGFSKKLHWLRNLLYDWCVPCTVCHCDQHNCKSGCCTNEECLHLHPVHSSDKLIVCKRSPRDEIVKIPGLGKWFRKKIENEEQSEDNQLFAPDQIDATAERQSSTRTKRSQRNRETVGDQNDASVEKHSANRLKRPSCSSTGVPEVTVGGRALQSSTRKRKASSATTQVTKRTRVTNVIDRVAFKEGKPSHRELDELAAKIGQKWDKLGIHLNISQDVLDEIAANAKDKPYRMLLRWRDESNSTTLYEDLYLALCHPRVGLNNVAKLFCRKETT